RGRLPGRTVHVGRRLHLVLRAAPRVDPGDPARTGPAHRQAAAVRPGPRHRRCRTQQRTQATRQPRQLTAHDSSEAERRRDIELIEACYAFPGDFPLSVIARNDEAVVEAIVATAAAAGTIAAHERQASSGGKYV